MNRPFKGTVKYQILLFQSFFFFFLRGGGGGETQLLFGQCRSKIRLHVLCCLTFIYSARKTSLSCPSRLKVDTDCSLILQNVRDLESNTTFDGLNHLILPIRSSVRFKYSNSCRIRVQVFSIIFGEYRFNLSKN